MMVRNSKCSIGKDDYDVGQEPSWGLRKHPKHSRKVAEVPNGDARDKSTNWYSADSQKGLPWNPPRRDNPPSCETQNQIRIFFNPIQFAWWSGGP